MADYHRQSTPAQKNKTRLQVIASYQIDSANRIIKPIELVLRKQKRRGGRKPIYQHLTMASNQEKNREANK